MDFVLTVSVQFPIHIIFNYFLLHKINCTNLWERMEYKAVFASDHKVMFHNYVMLLLLSRIRVRSKSNSNISSIEKNQRSYFY